MGNLARFIQLLVTLTHSISTFGHNLHKAEDNFSSTLVTICKPSRIHPPCRSHPPSSYFYRLYTRACCKREALHSHAVELLCCLLQYREDRFRTTSESTNQRVLWWAIAQTLLLVVVGFWQMRHLRSFFEAKKLV